jgi:hypothetical protein
MVPEDVSEFTLFPFAGGRREMPNTEHLELFRALDGAPPGYCLNNSTTPSRCRGAARNTPRLQV